MPRSRRKRPGDRIRRAKPLVDRKAKVGRLNDAGAVARRARASTNGVLADRQLDVEALRRKLFA